MRVFILIFILIHINTMSATYSLAGTDSAVNMKFLMKETGVTTFQIDVPWRDSHLNAVLSEEGIDNTFAPLDRLKETLDTIKKVDGKVIVQLSVHYLPEWFIREHKDKLLRNYRGSFEIQSDDLEKHYIPSPYSDLVKYQIIGAWYDYLGRFLKENYSDIIEYINPGILEEGQMSYPWSGYDGDELVFWSFDPYAMEGYRSYLDRIFSLSPDDSGRTAEKLQRINKKYGTFFLTWDEVRPPQTFDEVKYYKTDNKGHYPYFMEFLEFYAEGPLSSAKLYSDILQQYFPKEKLIIKIPHWHRGSQNKRTFAEGRFINYYIRDLKEHYGSIIFLPVQDPDYLIRYIKNAKNSGYKVLLEPTIKVGDWKEVGDIIKRVDINGINAVNTVNFLGDEGKIYREAYKKWISLIEGEKNEDLIEE